MRKTNLYAGDEEDTLSMFYTILHRFAFKENRLQIDRRAIINRMAISLKLSRTATAKIWQILSRAKLCCARPLSGAETLWLEIY